jgi:hypothetical protein
MPPRTLPVGLRLPVEGGAPTVGAPWPGSGFLPRIAVSVEQIACFGAVFTGSSLAGCSAPLDSLLGRCAHVPIGLPCSVDLRSPSSQQTCRAKRGGMLWMAGPSWLRWRMSCDGLVTIGRAPAVVRPTAGAVSLQSCGHCAHAIDKCLRDATRPTESGLSYMLPSSRVPSRQDPSAAKRL